MVLILDSVILPAPIFIDGRRGAFNWSTTMLSTAKAAITSYNDNVSQAFQTKVLKVGNLGADIPQAKLHRSRIRYTVKADIYDRV